MMRAIIYARFSPRRNEETCESSTRQIDRCRRYCDSRGIEVVFACSDDAVSGSTDFASRPAGQRVLGALRPGMSLVVTQADRLFRNAADGLQAVEQWNRQGIALHLVDQGGNSIDVSTPVGWLFFGQLALMAQFDRMVIGQKTSIGMLRRQSEGDRMSSQPPFGMRVDPDDETKIVDDPDEQRVLALAREWSECGFGPAEIARMLTMRGEKPRGKAWHRKTVSRIIERSKQV